MSNDDTSADKPEETTDTVATTQQGSDEENQALKTEVEKLRKANNDLVSQRDKNFEAKKSAENQLNNLTVNKTETEKINEFLEDNKEKYPDIELDDLKGIDSNSYEAIANRLQSRLQKKEQDILEEVRNPVAPKLTEKDIKARETELRNSNDPKAFEKMFGDQIQL